MIKGTLLHCACLGLPNSTISYSCHVPTDLRCCFQSQRPQSYLPLASCDIMLPWVLSLSCGNGTALSTPTPTIVSLCSEPAICSSCGLEQGLWKSLCCYELWSVTCCSVYTVQLNAEVSSRCCRKEAGQMMLCCVCSSTVAFDTLDKRTVQICFRKTEELKANITRQTALNAYTLT